MEPDGLTVSLTTLNYLGVGTRTRGMERRDATLDAVIARKRGQTWRDPPGIILLSFMLALFVVRLHCSYTWSIAVVVALCSCFSPRQRRVFSFVASRSLFSFLSLSGLFSFSTEISNLESRQPEVFSDVTRCPVSHASAPKAERRTRLLCTVRSTEYYAL